MMVLLSYFFIAAMAGIEASRLSGLSLVTYSSIASKKLIAL
jgi:hypothetical protein